MLVTLSSQGDQNIFHTFLNREGCDETLYYSCKAHLDELLSSLEEDGKEKRLISVLRIKYKTMVKHMEMTEALTEASRGRVMGHCGRKTHDREKEHCAELLASFKRALSC